MDRSNRSSSIQTNNAGRSISVHRNLFRTWITKSHDYPENYRSNQRYRYNKYFLPVILCLTQLTNATPAVAETVGGVSATAAPIANSSGSVTNQAIQVLQGPYITNTYGSGIQCQGETVNFTPYVTGAVSAQKPFQGSYLDNVYDMRDLTGDFDDDGNAIGDGAPDNPGDVLYRIPIRTGQKDNYNLSVGFSMTWSTPLDKKLQAQCKEAAAASISLMQQQAANKRLDFEIARLKNCGELIKSGISFHPRSRYARICADVVVRDKTYISPHTHSIPSVSKQNEAALSPDSDPAALLGGPMRSRPLLPSP